MRSIDDAIRNPESTYQVMNRRDNTAGVSMTTSETQLICTTDGEMASTSTIYCIYIHISLIKPELLGLLEIISFYLALDTGW